MSTLTKALFKNAKKKGKSSLGAMDIVNMGMTGYFFADGYSTARDEGTNFVGSVAKGISDAILVDVIGLPMYLGFQAATALPAAAVNTYEGLGKIARNINSMSNAPFQNSTFVDSQQAYTMRQASLNMAKMSKNNIQAAMLGNEAQFFK